MARMTTPRRATIVVSSRRDGGRISTVRVPAESAESAFISSDSPSPGRPHQVLRISLIAQINGFDYIRSMPCAFRQWLLLTTVAVAIAPASALAQPKPFGILDNSF